MAFTHKKTCPPVILNSLRILHAKDFKYLGLHLDSKLNYKRHILIKRKQLVFQLRKIYWLFDSKSLLPKSKLLYIRQFSNLFESVGSNRGVRSPIRI